MVEKYESREDQKAVQIDIVVYPPIDEIDKYIRLAKTDSELSIGVIQFLQNKMVYGELIKKGYSLVVCLKDKTYSQLRTDVKLVVFPPVPHEFTPTITSSLINNYLGDMKQSETQYFDVHKDAPVWKPQIVDRTAMADKPADLASADSLARIQKVCITFAVEDILRNLDTL